jgi:hypothetical protein
MWANVQLWLALIGLAREFVKYMRESDKETVIEAKQSLKDKDKNKFKEIMEKIF